MVFGIMKRGWATKPSVSDDLYSRMLNEALELAAGFRELGDVTRSMGITNETRIDENDLQNVLTEYHRGFSQLEAAARNLEETRPRSKELMDIHVAVIGFLRAKLLYQDRSTMTVLEALRGNNKQANKLMKETEKWEKSGIDMERDLNKRLAELKRTHPDYYAKLELDPSVLLDLRLYRG